MKSPRLSLPRLRLHLLLALPFAVFGTTSAWSASLSAMEAAPLELPQPGNLRATADSGVLRTVAGTATGEEIARVKKISAKATTVLDTNEPFFKKHGALRVMIRDLASEAKTVADNPAGVTPKDIKSIDANLKKAVDRAKAISDDRDDSQSRDALSVYNELKKLE